MGLPGVGRPVRVVREPSREEPMPAVEPVREPVPAEEPKEPVRV